LAGFTDAEGNFSITLRKFNQNNFSSLMLTSQIGLHIDDFPVLEYIKNKLSCGHISVSGNRCNYFINDKDSLFQILLPIFNFSKYFLAKGLLIFEKAVILINEKNHLSPEGKLLIIEYYNDIRKSVLAPSSEEFKNRILSKFWLGGFTDGDASFSVSNYKPRLKFENHIKEIFLFNRIKKFLNINNNLIISKPRLNRPNSNKTVNLDITNIHNLKNYILPLYPEDNLLKTKKLKDFKDWSLFVLIYYYAYHLLPEGKLLITEIKNNWNNFKLSSHFTLATRNDNNLEEKFNNLFKLPSPYIIKDGFRFIRNTNNFVSEGLNLSVKDIKNNQIFIFTSITECSNILKIDRKIIKICLFSGEPYKNFEFKFTANS
jgi:hypothetical protein